MPDCSPKISRTQVVEILFLVQQHLNEQQDPGSLRGFGLVRNTPLLEQIYSVVNDIPDDAPRM